MADTIICSACGQEKPRHRPQRRQCKECYQVLDRERVRKYQAANPEKVIARRKAYYAANREQLNAANRAYYANNADRLRASHNDYYHSHREQQAVYALGYRQRNRQAISDNFRKYRNANRARLTEYNRDWHIRNKPRQNAKAKQYYAANRAYLNRKQREWYQANAPYARGQAKAYRRRNPEMVSAGHMRRNDRERNLSPIPRGWKVLQMKRQGGKCAGCFNRFGRKRPATIDHILALVNGGNNDPANLQLLCGSCNSRKNRLPEHVWRRRNGMLL